jgi:nitrate reductase cytochrome c-type subunit
MKNKQMIMWTLLVLLTLMLWGCGSSRDSSGTVVGDADEVLANAETLGITNCTTCHTATSSLQTFTWLNSLNPHSISSTSLKDSDSSCAPCHNQLQDGQRMPTAFFAEGSPLMDARNVVGCESCHGGGQLHLGNPAGVPFPSPTSDQCGVCHGAGQPSWHPDESQDLAVGFATSPHKNSLNEHVWADAAETEVRAQCSKCHSAQGAREHRMIAGDHDQLVLAFDGVADISNPTAVECQACHMPHEESVPLLDIDTVFAGGLQYNTCTNCHQLTYPILDYTGAVEPLAGEWMKDGYHAPPVNPYGDYGEIISDTHYDDPATDASNTKVIEGYVVRNNETTACADCHNLHNNDNTINNQWALSAHGGHIAEAKEAAEAGATDVFAAGVNENAGTPGFAAAWTHYDWDDTNASGPAAPFGGAGDCQRCHTSTGTSNFMTDPGAYVPANNDFGYLADWTANGWSPQNELLYCWGCHTDAGLGDLRTPGAITEDYGNGAVVNYPDMKNTNVCLTCHVGREIGDVIQGSAADFSNTSFVNSHYLAAGASVFAVSGFEYPAMNYNNVSFYAHDSIGTVYEVDTHGTDVVSTDDDMGPCVGCHLTSEEGHKFLPFEINAAGTAFDYITPVCAECHSGGFALTPAIIEEEEAGYAAAIEVLEVALDQQGYTFLGGYPYFSNTNWIPALGTTQDGKNTMGAAFNFNLAAHEPGGFAHNRFYYKRLLWDSIDWMDDFIMNDSVSTTMATFETGLLITPEVSAEANSYLGTGRPGTGTPDRPAIPGLDPT